MQYTRVLGKQTCLAKSSIMVTVDGNKSIKFDDIKVHTKYRLVTAQTLIP